MAEIKKLETICLKSVVESGVVIQSESIPAPLAETIKEMRAINGRYITQDNQDSISSIEVHYDGETIALKFIIHGKLHKVFCKKQMSTPIYKALLLLVKLKEDALMDVDILSKEDVTIVELSCNDSGWKWSFSLEIR